MANATYDDPSFSRLRSPAQDAKSMISILEDVEIGNFSVVAVIDRKAHDVSIEIDRFLKERQSDDLALVYLSCHGVLNPKGHLYFAAANSQKDYLSSTAVAAAWLLDRLEECNAKQQVVILVCCFSGAFAGIMGDSDLDLGRRLVGAGRGRAVLTASRASEYSYEGELLPGGTVNGSIFTTALISGIRNGTADRNKDGLISVEEAFAHAAEQVGARKGAQSPQRWLYGGEGDIILARNPHGVPVHPAPLPGPLRSGLESPYAQIRRASVNVLGGWLRSDDPGEVLAAKRELSRIASDESGEVAQAAQRILHESANEGDTPQTVANGVQVGPPPRKRPFYPEPLLRAFKGPFPRSAQFLLRCAALLVLSALAGVEFTLLLTTEVWDYDNIFGGYAVGAVLFFGSLAGIMAEWWLAPKARFSISLVGGTLFVTFAAITGVTKGCIETGENACHQNPGWTILGVVYLILGIAFGVPRLRERLAISRKIYYIGLGALHSAAIISAAASLTYDYADHIESLEFMTTSFAGSLIIAAMSLFALGVEFFSIHSPPRRRSI